MENIEQYLNKIQAPEWFRKHCKIGFTFLRTGTDGKVYRYTVAGLEGIHGDLDFETISEDAEVEYASGKVVLSCCYVPVSTMDLAPTLVLEELGRLANASWWSQLTPVPVVDEPSDYSKQTFEAQDGSKFVVSNAGTIYRVEPQDVLDNRGESDEYQAFALTVKGNGLDGYLGSGASMDSMMTWGLALATQEDRND